MNHDIADPSLAEAGALRIEWAKGRMPVLALLFPLLTPQDATTTAWPHFRGPDLDGRASAETPGLTRLTANLSSDAKRIRVESPLFLA